jgi:hypothetical protein
MEILNKSNLRLMLNEFKKFMVFAQAQRVATPSDIKEAGLLIERFDEFLASDGYFETEFQNMLNKMSVIKTRIEKSAAELMQSVAAVHTLTK